MKRVVIFGNSGSGKSTLAKEYVKKYNLSHLDLDILAWNATSPPTRRPLNESTFEINEFINKNKMWVIEGGYSDLLNFVIKKSNKLIFLNPGTEICISNCRNRPWEPHKYKSEEEQNNNLEMLLNWVTEYSMRDDEFSLISHLALFDGYNGSKTEYKSNDRNA